MYCEDTPIDQYCINGIPVLVKRDDLFATNPAPPLGKLRGLRAAFSRLRLEGKQHIGCFEAHRSKVGLAVAAACQHEGDFTCTVVYPQFGNSPLRDTIKGAEALGAKIVPVRGNHTPINHNQAKQIVEAEAGWMIPFGFEFTEAIDAIAEEACRIPSEFVKCGTIVVPCGSGVTLAGIARGLGNKPKAIVGVSIGRSERSIKRCISSAGIVNAINIKIIEPRFKYSEKSDGDAPFPCDKFYDLKAWSYLINNISEFRNGPVLFWNVGS